MVPKPITLRCRSKNGQQTINDLTSDSTFLELKAYVLSVTGFDYNRLLLKTGYPPTPLLAEDDSLLIDCGIQNGDVIIAEETSSISNDKATASTPNKRVSSPPSHHKHSNKVLKETSCMCRKVVPANNSCLFASIYFCLNGTINQSKNHEMRKIVADKILANTEKYNEALLGRAPSDYARWISTSNAWGGAIELSILCEYYSMQMTVIDIQNIRSEKFGENYPDRILLIYDGIHYDALYETSLGTRQRTIFPTSDDSVIAKALSLAEQENSKRQYTDTGKFSLKCLVCHKGFVGAQEASSHAEDTGHQNFGET